MNQRCRIGRVSVHEVSRSIPPARLAQDEDSTIEAEPLNCTGPRNQLKKPGSIPPVGLGLLMPFPCGWLTCPGFPQLRAAVCGFEIGWLLVQQAMPTL